MARSRHCHCEKRAKRVTWQSTPFSFQKEKSGLPRALRPRNDSPERQQRIASLEETLINRMILN